jgi:hypothetical protein
MSTTPMADPTELIRRLKARFTTADLDDHVTELKAQEAANINNQGIDSQILYLIDRGGIEWVESLLD